jgi:penicillin-binding protein 1A
MEAHLRAAQQYFPTYKLDPKRTDIGLREYDLAAKALEADQRSLTAAAGVALFSGGVAATVFGSSTASTSLGTFVSGAGFTGLIVLSSLFLVISLLLTHYFARLQRSATHAARKIVVLRRLLGLDYGTIETVLPADTLDGANEPFAIRMFPGWRSLQAIPQLAVALLSGVAQAILFSTSPMPLAEGSFAGAWSAPLAGALMFAISLVFYRVSLLESYESVRFLIARMLATSLGVPLKQRIGHVLYRIRLAIYEAKRLKLDLAQLHPMLVQIEDRDFYRHNGNSVKAACGAVWRYYRYGARAGGSTILQQTVRSNFLKTLNPRLRRKLLEWLLAPWLNRQFDKKEALDAYLVSVRYARDIIGIVPALRHYFPDHPLTDPLPRHMQFLLIERLSNVSQSFPEARIQCLVDSCKRAGLMEDSDVARLNSSYSNLAQAGKIDLQGRLPTLR